MNELDQSDPSEKSHRTLERKPMIDGRQNLVYSPFATSGQDTAEACFLCPVPARGGISTAVAHILPALCLIFFRKDVKIILRLEFLGSKLTELFLSLPYNV